MDPFSLYIYSIINGNRVTIYILIRRRSDYIIGFIAPAIGPNKPRKLTRFIAPAHNIRGKVWMKNNMHGFTDRQLSSVKPCMLFFIRTLPRILCAGAISRVSFLGFVWTDCWANKSYYVITSPVRIEQSLGCTVYILRHMHNVQMANRW